MDYTQSGNSATNAINQARATAVQTGNNPYSGAGATAMSNSAGLGNFQPTNSLNAGQAGNISPLSVPSPYASTVSSGISGAADALVNQTKGAVATDQSNVDQSKQQLTDVMNKIVGVQGSEAGMEQAAGLPDKQQAITNASNALDTSRQAQNNEIAALDKQLLTPQQKIAATNDINHRYALDQANQSVILSAANRDYSTASSIIQHKIDLQLAPLQTQKDFYTQFFNDNKDILSKAEQNQFSAMSTKATEAYDTAKTQLTQMADIQKTAMTNGAPSDVLAAIGQAKTPNDAAQAAGQYGATAKYTSVSNPVTGELTSFNTRTGQYGGSSGGRVAPNVGPTSSAPTINSNGQVAHPPTGNPIIDQAQQLVDGNITPSQLSKRGASYNATLTKANELSIAQTGKPYDASASENAFKFRNSDTYQKYTANAPVAISTITKIADLAQKLNLQGPDALNSLKVTTTASGLNPFASQEDRSNAKELKSLLAVSADDIGLLLGAGSGSDFKTQLGSVIFGADGNVRTTQDLASTIQDRVKSKLGDYYAKAGVTNPDSFAKLDSVGIANSSGQTPSTPSITKSGKTFDIAGAKKAGYTDADIQTYLATH